MIYQSKPELQQVDAHDILVNTRTVGGKSEWSTSRYSGFKIKN